MRRHLSVRARTALTALVLAAVVCVSPGIPAPAGAASPAAASLDAASVQESIQYLVHTFGVMQAEALRRLELQNDAQALDRDLTKSAAGTYGGMWIDQEGGGVLVLATTRPDLTASYLHGRIDSRYVVTRRVTRSLSKLQSIEARLSVAVAAGPAATYLPEISLTENRVVVWQRPWVAAEKARQAVTTSAGRAVEAESAAAARAVAAEGDGATMRSLVEPHPLYQPYVDWGFCHPLYCAYYGPMRGGLRLDVQRDDGSWGGCTSGFNVRSSGGAYSGWAWILTAGHCVLGPNHQDPNNTTPLQHDGFSVFNDSGLIRNSYPYDYAILNYVDGQTAHDWLETWTGRNRVLMYCRNGGQDSDASTPCGPQATSQDLSITGIHSLGEIRPGWIVCATGSGSSAVNYPDSYDSGAGAGYLVGTRCGRVTSTDVGINTDICARAGDSGGPLFSQLDNTAYGILEGNIQERQGACQPGELNDYVPISTILHDVNVDQPSSITGGSTFNIITSSQG
jgi:streptogrisin C